MYKIVKTDLKLLLLFCYYIYPFKFQNHLMLSYTVLYFLPLLYIFINMKHWTMRFQINNIQKYCAFSVVFLFLLSIALPFVHNTNDFSYVMTTTYIFRKLCIYMFLLIAVIKRHNDNITTCHFMYYFAYATSIYAIITLCFAFVPSVANWWINLISEPQPLMLLQSYGYSMRIGWQGYSGFRCTIRCTLSVIFILYLILKKYPCTNKHSLYIVLILSLMGNAFYGRSGLLISLIMLLLTSVHILTSRINKLPVFLVSILLFLFFVVVLGNIYEPVHDWYIWMTTPFVNFMYSGTFDNYSVDRLMNDMIFSPEWNTILFGDGYYTDPINKAYYLNTDSGFMRSILFWGVPGTIIAYFTVFLLIIKMPVSSCMLKLMLFMSFSIFEIKGGVYYEYIALLFPLLCTNRRQYLYNKITEVEN